MRRHWAVAALLACLTPLLLAFGWQGGLASLSDDSASYLILAQALVGANPAVLPWTGYQAHFPPLFPMLLAVTGGASDFRIAHGLVALLAALGMLVTYGFALCDTGRRDAAFALVVAFALCPTAWISAKGIMSEPLYLGASLACLAYFCARLEGGRGEPKQWLVFGLLIAAAILTRVVGAVLVGALLLHLGVRAVATRTWPGARRLAAAVVPVVVLVALWIAFRPVAAQDTYQRVSGAMLQSWISDPMLMATVSAKSVIDGWVASFTADANVGVAARAVAVLAGALGLAGLGLRLRRNRLDAWYVAISLAILAGWVISDDGIRRLLYPLLPLLLLYAGQAVAWACAKVRRPGYGPRAVGVAATALAIACAPATALVARKALDRQPVLDGHAPRFSDITDYYTTLNVAHSRAIAAKHAAVLAGLEAIARVTPPDARVMWMRPEYIALLGRRTGVAWFYEWDAGRVAREVRDARVDYLVVAQLFKTDLHGRRGDPFAALGEVSAFSQPTLVLSNPAAGGTEFVLLRVDRAALESALAGR